ncbi:MAG: type I DNA topoisomerase [Verrucomicrobiota bacterium]|nr:type I DNA topoisomerase [Verrucomicrobiota bacterium]
MADKLVIVESPAKAKTINRILGADYVVRPSMGHVRDLPERSLGVDVKNGFKPKYVVAKGKRKVIEALVKTLAGCHTVYLAPDPDREGEAIAWHLQELLRDAKNERRFVRVQYNEITPQAVRAAFQKPGEIDMKRVDAQQARRVLDRLVGYTVSPMLWRKLRRGLSAGRVQSVALRLLCEREREILKFVPEEYWILGAMARKLVAPLDPFRVKLVQVDGEKREVKSADMARQIRADLEGRSLRVSDISVVQVSRRPYPPFITSTLQQGASTAFGFSPSRTMGIAQKLYEGIAVDGEHAGLITYMRTDSVNVSQQALGAAREYIRQAFGPEYCPERPHLYKSRASAQEAHEAIRPTDIARHPDSLAGALDPSELKLYRLIWNRFVASQMAPARIERRAVKVEALPGAGQTRTYLFQAVVSEVKFPGFMRMTGVDLGKREEDGEAEEAAALPSLAIGENLQCLQWLGEKKETQPPRRYSEASLIRALEVNGVGRPSTYAQTIATLMDRAYADREKRVLRPTELGLRVNDLLVATLNELFDVKFTARMEESLDEIEKGAVGWVRMLDAFYRRFEGWMEATREPPTDPVTVREAMDMLGRVSNWAPPVEQDGRTYSDERFARSVAKQLADGRKAISQRQLDALLRIGIRYRAQIAGMEDFLKRIGRETLLAEPSAQPLSEETRKKLDLLGGLELDESAARFVASLAGQADRGRTLSPAQIRAMDRILVSHRKQIPDFEAVAASLGVRAEAQAEDHESKPLLEALKSVTDWKPPVARGNKSFDDREFFLSLSAHFGRKGYLTDRQRAALKRMAARYREQAPNYDKLAADFGIGRKPAPGTASDHG